MCPSPRQEASCEDLQKVPSVEWGVSVPGAVPNLGLT